MERRRALKLAVGIGGPALAVWAGIGCGEGSSGNRQGAQVDSTPKVTADKKSPEIPGVTKSRRIGEPVGDFTIGNVGGETLNYQKDLAGRALIIFYCCDSATLEDITKIEGLKQKWDSSKLEVVNVIVVGARRGPLQEPTVDEDTTQKGTSFSGFSGNGSPYLVAIDKNGILVDQRRGRNTVSAGIEELAEKLVNSD